MAGGFKKFGPTYNSTYYVRTGFEGDINGLHNISQTLVNAHPATNGEPSFGLAGKMAAIGTDGVTLANKGVNAVGLFREDLEDMVNASMKASFYFRGGEYYVAEARLGVNAAGTQYKASDFSVGGLLTTDANGGLVPMPVDDTAAALIIAASTAASFKAVATVTSVGLFPAGNMYAWAGDAANGGQFLGFILHM